MKSHFQTLLGEVRLILLGFSNGQHLLNLALERNLVITNTTFQKRIGKRWTYLSDMTGYESQIDFIIVNRKWRNYV